MAAKQSILHAVYLHLQNSFTGKKCVSRILRHCWHYVELEDGYSKKPVSSTKKDISDHIHQVVASTPCFDSSGCGCQNSSKVTTFQPTMRILGHNANPLELLNPENDWHWHWPTTYLKIKKAINHLNIRFTTVCKTFCGLRANVNSLALLTRMRSFLSWTM